MSERTHTGLFWREVVAVGTEGAQRLVALETGSRALRTLPFVVDEIPLFAFAASFRRAVAE